MHHPQFECAFLHLYIIYVTAVLIFKKHAKMLKKMRQRKLTQKKFWYFLSHHSS